jgi:hypothetical protein
MTHISADHTGTPRFGPLYRSLIVSVALPLIVVQVLLHRGMPAVTALAISALFPFADALVGLVRKRRFDPIAVLSLIAIIAGVGTAGLSGNPAFAVAKESLFTFVFGLVFLGSLATPRPLIFQLGKQFSTGGDPAAIAAWEQRWEQPGFRRALRLITAVWGIGLLLEAMTRVVVAFTLPVGIATIVSPALGIGVLGALFAWTTLYARAARRAAAVRASAAAA